MTLYWFSLSHRQRIAQNLNETEYLVWKLQNHARNYSLSGEQLVEQLQSPLQDTVPAAYAAESTAARLRALRAVADRVLDIQSLVTSYRLVPQSRSKAKHIS